MIGSAKLKGRNTCPLRKEFAREDRPASHAGEKPAFTKGLCSVC